MRIGSKMAPGALFDVIPALQLNLKRCCCGTRHGGWRVPPRFPGELATELGFSVMHGTFGCDGGGGKRGQGGTAGAIEEAPTMLKNKLYMAS